VRNREKAEQNDFSFLLPLWKSEVFWSGENTVANDFVAAENESLDIRHFIGVCYSEENLLWGELYFVSVQI
jgi:hypothetical protein